MCQELRRRTKCRPRRRPRRHEILFRDEYSFPIELRHEIVWSLCNILNVQESWHVNLIE